MLSEGPKIEPDKYRRHCIALRFAELSARFRCNHSDNIPKPAELSNYGGTAIAGAGRAGR